MTQCSRIFVFLCLVGFFGFAGCNADNRPPGLPTLYPVVLTLTQEGAPLEGASVTFYPQDAGNKWSSGGKSDAQGKVQVFTHGNFAGMPEGKYKVTVSKTVEENPPMKEDDPPATGVFSLVDKKYNSQRTTDLEIEVKSAPDNQIELDLGAAVRIKI